MEFAIRPATVADAEAMLAIYAPYVRETAITFEVAVPTIDEFRQRIVRTTAKYPWLVAEGPDGVVGYAYANTFKGRAAYDWSVETSIYLDRDLRGRGLGTALYSELERILQLMGIRNLNACIACTERTDDPYLSNASVTFHAKMGYADVGTFHNCGFKLGNWYSMLWMEKMIGPHDCTPDPVASRPERADDAAGPWGLAEGP